MTRDETIAFFLECEAKRNEARAAAVAEGKSEIEAEKAAHEAAKAKWNAWANKLVERRCDLERSRLFALKTVEDDVLFQSFEGDNTETCEWVAAATVDFAQVHFEKPENTQTDMPEDGASPRSSLVTVRNDPINFSGWIFPWSTNFAMSKSNVALDFSNAQFRGPTTFYEMRVASRVYFKKAIFYSNTAFNGCIIEKRASFDDVRFLAPVRFDRVYFQRSARFTNAIFEGYAWFNQATFNNYVVFRGAQFFQAARFDAMHALRNFVLDKTQFHVSPPTFVQANFIEAPSFETVKLPRPEFFRGGDASRVAAYRALRRIAIQGHDHEIEARAFKGEIRSKRFFTDWPWHPAFWFGLIYDASSDFGRSTLRPFIAWSLSILAFAVYFLGQSPEMIAKRKVLHRSGVYGQTIAYSTVALEAVRQRPPSACLSEETEKNLPNKRLELDTQGNGFSGLTKQVREQTNLVNEAFSLAYHNAVILLDNSGDSMHRAHGCLYGVERYGGNPVAYVPRSVAIASGVQKLLSAIFIFLFGLALRNMLKVK